EGQTNVEILQRVIQAAPQPLSEEVSVAVRLVVARALAKAPADRYQSMHDMVADLRRIIRPGFEVSAPTHRKRRLSKSAGAVAGLLIASMAWWIVHMISGTAPRIRSIAVLPLQDLSGDPDQEYLAVGMTEAR